MSETVGSTRRAKRLLSAEQKYEIWLKILTGEVTTNEAAAQAGVDRSNGANKHHPTPEGLFRGQRTPSTPNS